MALFGHGDAVIQTLNPIAAVGGKTLMHELCYAGIAINSNPTEVEAHCRDPKTGLLKAKRKGLNEIVHQVTLTFEHLDWQHMGLVHNELPQVAAGAGLLKTQRVVVPAVAPFEIADANIVAGNVGSVRVYISAKGTYGDGGAMTCTADNTTAPTAYNEVQVDDANSKLVFDAALAGAKVFYVYQEIYTSIQSIGVNPTWEAYGDIEMWFTGYGNDDFAEGVTYHFPEMVRTATPPAFNYDQSPVTVSIVYEANGVDGRNFPYRMYNKEFATV